MEQILISSFKIDVVRKNIKNIHLAVYPPTGRVRIAAPLKVNDDAIRLFAISKLSWIKRYQKNLKDRNELDQENTRTEKAIIFKAKDIC